MRRRGLTKPLWETAEGGYRPGMRPSKSASSREEASADVGRIAADLVDRYHELCGAGGGWLSYHLGGPTRFGSSLIWALAECELNVPGLGRRLVEDLHAVRYVPAAVNLEAWKARFEELIQKLAEVLVARTLCMVRWPTGTEIQYEPVNPSNGKRPEFSVVTPDRTYLLEVKCPSFIKHQERRGSNEHHLPVRSVMRDVLAEGATATLPRDGTIKDFLVSAQAKFENFTEDAAEGYLIVVWDQHMYEAIGSLNHPETGLLTPASWYKKGGLAVTFPDVSGVIVINRLEQLKAGAQEMSEFPDVFQLGGPNSLPNTWHPNGAVELDELLSGAFDAQHFEGLGIAADYSMLEYILWMKPAGERAARDAHRRRRRTMLRQLEAGVSRSALVVSASRLKGV